MPLADCNWTPSGRALWTIVPIAALALFLLLFILSYRSTDPSRRMALILVFGAGLLIGAGGLAIHGTSGNPTTFVVTGAAIALLIGFSAVALVRGREVIQFGAVALLGAVAPVGLLLGLFIFTLASTGTCLD